MLRFQRSLLIPGTEYFGQAAKEYSFSFSLNRFLQLFLVCGGNRLTSMPSFLCLKVIPFWFHSGDSLWNNKCMKQFLHSTHTVIKCLKYENVCIITIYLHIYIWDSRWKGKTSILLQSASPRFELGHAFCSMFSHPLRVPPLRCSSFSIFHWFCLQNLWSFSLKCQIYQTWIQYLSFA